MTAHVDRLDEALRVITTEARGTYEANVPDGWQQGRGAYGGVVLGLLARAMEFEQPDVSRRLRTLSGEIVAPVLPGPARLVVTTVREGSGTTSLRAELRQDDEVRAHGHALFGKSRVADRNRVDLPPLPSLKNWQDVEVLPVEPPIGPDFARHFEFRSTGPFPFSGGSAPEAAGFVRLKHPLQRFTSPDVIAHVDAWWPTAFAVEEAPRPMATVSFNVQLFEDPATLPADAPFFQRSRMLASRDGYFMELRELWSADGRLVALNPQTFAIIR